MRPSCCNHNTSTIVELYIDHHKSDILKEIHDGEVADKDIDQTLQRFRSHLQKKLCIEADSNIIKFKTAARRGDFSWYSGSDETEDSDAHSFQSTLPPL